MAIGVVVDKVGVVSSGMKGWSRVARKATLSGESSLENLERDAFLNELDNKTLAGQTPVFPLDLENGERVREEELPWTGLPILNLNNVSDLRVGNGQDVVWVWYREGLGVACSFWGEVADRRRPLPAEDDGIVEFYKVLVWVGNSDAQLVPPVRRLRVIQHI